MPHEHSLKRKKEIPNWHWGYVTFILPVIFIQSNYTGETFCQKFNCFFFFLVISISYHVRKPPLRLFFAPIIIILIILSSYEAGQCLLIITFQSDSPPTHTHTFLLFAKRGITLTWTFLGMQLPWEHPLIVRSIYQPWPVQNAREVDMFR